MITPDALPDFVNVSELNHEKQNYTIYTLKSIPDDDLENRIYRSAILSADKRLLCVAPAKSLPEIRKTGGTFFLTEIVEGTMINLFWDGNKWEIATKKKLGGRNYFFKNKYQGVDQDGVEKTFREMFEDALNIASIEFDKSYCYSFVLQHPYNHIVTRVEKPQLYLVSTYKIAGLSYEYLNPLSHPDYENFVKQGILFPRTFDVSRVKITEEPIEAKFALSLGRLTFEEVKGLETHIRDVVSSRLNSPASPGVMVTDLETGLRTTFYNPKYLELKLLRGNNPNLHFHYLMLRKTGKVAEFLQYFPMYAKHFNHFHEHFKFVKKRIRKLYWQVHVKKTATLTEQSRDKYFVEKLHYEVFLPQKKLNKNFFITDGEVEKFLDSENVIIPLGPQ
jgi:hypothetical protein